MKWKPTIGLEIHAELKTQTKMFCNSKNDPDETRPNVNICPVCMAHPGTLPVINKEAVRHILRMGVAVGGELADFTEFDRKNYFYPDIPKGYQISQYQFPLVRGGTIAGVALTRIHLEEDTARSTHDEHEKSLVDFNRAGVPLMELVTEPVIKSAAEAVTFAKELQLLLRNLGAGEANMEKGEMRVEANISVSTGKTLGTKVEIKNLNSFRAVERAIEKEIKRQVALLEEGGEVVQETRGWDEGKGMTFSQRKKESSHDYRYFPDPDLPKLWISEIPELSANELRHSLPELPWEKRSRYLSLGLKEEDANLFVSDNALRALFETFVGVVGDDKKSILLGANYIANDVAALRGRADGQLQHIRGAEIRKIVDLVEVGKMNSRNAKDTIEILFREGGSVEQISETRGLLRDESIDLQSIASLIISENFEVVSEYKAGKASALEFLVGKGMKMTKGAVDPNQLRESLLAKLK